MSLSFRTLTGAEVESALDDLAALRIRVFHDWPYLYDGDLDYERRYLSTYRDAPRAILVAAFDGTRIVGASTGTPLEDHAGDFAAAFDGTGYALDQVFYCAESVLLPEYRGQGAGHAFFDARERHARALGRRFCTFCGVVRPDDHPLRPADYRPLDAFWKKRGYETLPGAVAQFAWKDIDRAEATSHDLQFWIKPL